MKGWCRCAMCDEWYNPKGERAKIHDHPEPQSGVYRDAWLDSDMSYLVWIEKTRVGKDWVEYKKKTKVTIAKNSF